MYLNRITATVAVLMIFSSSYSQCDNLLPTSTKHNLNPMEES